ncbi:MAG: hypothetical protein MUE37_14920 [Bacteroidales bacterium]|jgi:hypothetical protein|nr:hypothetical protein [Bacteroidales bacterium]
MKIKAVILLAVLVTLGGCEWIKNLGNVDFDTDLILSVLISSDMKKGASAATEVADISFTGSAVLSLVDNEDIEPYIEKLKEIDLESVEVTIPGLTGEQTITTISLSVTGVGIICTHSNITSSTGTFTPAIDEDMLLKAGKKLLKDGSITLVVSGTSSGIIENLATIVFGAKVTAGALS